MSGRLSMCGLLRVRGRAIPRPDNRTALRGITGGPPPPLPPLPRGGGGEQGRARFLFRDTLDAVRRLVELKADPSAFWKRPWRYRSVPFTLLHMLPKRVRRGPVLAKQTTVSQLPQLVCWPKDGGAFVTLPQ